MEPHLVTLLDYLVDEMRIERDNWRLALIVVRKLVDLCYHKHPGIFQPFIPSILHNLTHNLLQKDIPMLVQIIHLTPVEILNQCKKDLYDLVQRCFTTLECQYTKEVILEAARMIKYFAHKTPSKPLQRIYRHLPSFVQSQVRAILSMALTDPNGDPRYPQSPFHRLPENVVWDIIEMVIECEMDEDFPADDNLLEIQINDSFSGAAELLYEFHIKDGLQLDIWQQYFGASQYQ